MIGQMVKTIWQVIAMVLVTFLVGGAIAVISSSINASGEVEYCYIVYKEPPGAPPAYQLWAFRSWRRDQMIGTFSAIETTVEKANLVNCRLGTRRAEAGR